jgi:D-serine dehydratase
MKNKLVAGKPLQEWISKFPLINNMLNDEEVFWMNPEYTTFHEAKKKINLTEDDVKDAEERLNRFSTFIMELFPETKDKNGIIESPIVRIPNMREAISKMFDQEIPGELILKMDSHLAIAGSIKARGGIYEVLKHTEDLALENNLITLEDDYSKLARDEYRKFFNKYTIQVGSTGNLGLSIGIMGAKIGYKVVVHMSSDAKQWKKNLLRSKGVTVVEYSSDYSKAVKEGRKLSDADPKSYFVDDENSENLFLGYSVAAGRLKKQLGDMNIFINSANQLFVYLPCGVGGGPGGVAFGLKLIFKDNVHCFFAEPTHSPCMLLGMMTEKNEEVCVQDFGIDNITAADGLAVGRPSGFVGKTLKELLSGVYTVKDDKLHALLSTLADTEGIYLEPSACAGIPGIVELFKNEVNLEYIKKNKLTNKMSNSIHIAWGTGGNLVPKESMDEYYRIGLEVLKNYNRDL